MASLQIALNGLALVSAGSSACCSLSWSVVCSRYEPNGASLTVSGIVERQSNIYDHLYWLEDYPLANGDVVNIVVLAADGGSEVARVHTHEQLDALRAEVSRAEAAGEYDAARAATRVPARASCAVGLSTVNGSSLQTASGAVTTVICSGDWNAEHRPSEWRLRLWSMPVESTVKGAWQSIEGGALVTVGEA
ncbi:hypothetical protein ABXN37_27725 [Piscinibacter sakaiensis]|uniref:hypothetical protein n=1 Tax=Piscinibacter sakaiensis TaxID=1547922 RepID=UPI0012FBDE5E|nr:hypothetical protein [Piscinibacter sakaiensis]